MSKKWVLSHGIHRGTITSRDSTSEEFDTKEEALSSLQSQKEFYKNIGYKIWFANLISPDGEETRLGGDSNYR